jgi:hypothetical protein
MRGCVGAWVVSLCACVASESQSTCSVVCVCVCVGGWVFVWLVGRRVGVVWSGARSVATRPRHLLTRLGAWVGFSTRSCLRRRASHVARAAPCIPRSACTQVLWACCHHANRANLVREMSLGVPAKLRSGFVQIGDHPPRERRGRHRRR